MRCIWVVELVLITGDINCAESVERQVVEAIRGVNGWDVATIGAQSAHAERDVT
jgi:hypothetical protein